MPQIIEHPSVWNGGELPQRSDWLGEFDSIDPGTLRDRLENGSGAVMLRGFPVEDYSKDNAREAFGNWCAGYQMSFGYIDDNRRQSRRL